MTDAASLLPVITGFFLTTVLGGALGFFFQNRSWEHQHKIQQASRSVRIEGSWPNRRAHRRCGFLTRSAG